MAEATLSFLGFGYSGRFGYIPSLGALINEGLAYILVAPWITLFPSLILFMTVFLLNYIGDFFRYKLRMNENG